MDHRALNEILDAAELAEEHDRFDLLDELRDQPGLDAATDLEAFRAARLLAKSGDPADLPAVARLSLQAHSDGVDGAGLIHAEASDKIALYSGRPQLYGTVMLEQNGELVQPPVDKRVGDDERVALGVPPLGELRDRMHGLARELAVERAQQPGWLPQNHRFCRVWTEPDPALLRTRLGPEGHAVWAEGDILSFVVESHEPVTVPPAFPIETWSAGDGLQVLSVRVERLAEAVITYTFTPVGGMPSFGGGRGSHDGRFRGEDSPPELPSNEVLVGSVTDHEIESAAFGSTRTVSVYTPPGHVPGGDMAVVYATDGNMLAPYARRLDAMIEADRCPPVVVVAAHAARFDPVFGNRRAAEYLPGFDPSLHTAHRSFFVHELSEWAQAELGVSADRSRRAVWGCSDGAGHAALLAKELPERYAHAFVFSTGMPPDLNHEWTADHPMMHLCAGTLEGGFHQATQAWAGYLSMLGAEHHFTERVAAHDLIQWAEELPRALARTDW